MPKNYYIAIFIMLFIFLLTIAGIFQKYMEDMLKENFISAAPEMGNLEKYMGPAPINTEPEEPHHTKTLNDTVSYSPFLPQINNELPETNTVHGDVKEKIFYQDDFTKYQNPWELKEPLPKHIYPLPEDMDNTTRNAFKLGYPPNMTMQDYVNWLYLWKDDSDGLTIEHKENFEKLIHFQPLQYKENILPPPYRKMMPFMSNEYFEKLYRDPKTAPKLNWATQLGQNPIMPSNSERYNNFYNNFDTKFLSEMPSPNPDLYMKKSAYTLKKFIGPTYIETNRNKY